MMRVTEAVGSADFSSHRVHFGIDMRSRSTGRGSRSVNRAVVASDLLVAQLLSGCMTWDSR